MSKAHSSWIPAIMGSLVLVAVLTLVSSLSSSEAKSDAEKISTCGGDTKRLLQAHFGSRSLVAPAAVSSGGKWLAYASVANTEHAHGNAYYRGARLSLLNLATGAIVTPVPDADTSWLPEWDPSGSKLAFLAIDAGDTEGRQRLWIYDVDSGRARRLLDAPIAIGIGGKPTSPRWTADGKGIVVSKMRSPQAGHVMTSDGANPKQLVEIYRSGEEASASGNTIETAQADYYMATEPADIVRIDVGTGLVQTLHITAPTGTATISPSGLWVATHSPVTNMPVKTNGQYDHGRYHYYTTDLSILPTNADGSTKFSVQDVDYPEARDIDLRWLSEDRLIYQTAGLLNLVELKEGQFQSKPLAHEAVRAVSFEPSLDGRWVLAVGGFDNTRGGLPGWSIQTSELFMISLADEHVRRLALPAGARVGAGSLLTVQSRLWQPSPNEVMLLAQEEITGRQVLLRYDVKSERARTVWRGSGIAKAIDGGADQHSIVFSYEDTSIPLSLWRMQLDGTFERLVEINPVVPEFPQIEVRQYEVDVPGWDGQRLTVRPALILPKGTSLSARLPTLAVSYPGAIAGAHAHTYGGGQEGGVPTAVLLSRGYAVLLLELPVRPRTSIGNRAQESSDVILAQVQAVAARGYIDVNRVALAGWSQGAYTAAAVATYTNLFRAYVFGAGAYDLVGASGALMGWGEQSLSLGSPWDNIQRYIENSAFYRADRINAPVLMLVGSEDVKGAVDEHLKLFGALRRLGKSSQLAIYVGEGHALFSGSVSAAIDASERILDFLDRHLRSLPPRVPSPG